MILTALKSTNCCVRRELVEPDPSYRLAAGRSVHVTSPRVPKRRPGQSLERRDFLRHLVEQAFDAGKAVLAGDIENQLVQKFPFRPRVAARLDRFHESLHAAFDVGERAALFRMRATRQKVMRRRGRVVRQNVADDQRFQTCRADRRRCRASSRLRRKQSAS